ncbi:MAG TPA: flagellar basal body-associated FliL family protein [Spirochaetia bacterium]|jgi:flagellar FliL protein|nr:flagellar basal body-associated FliL family protein [Spirochaetia bacterium]
MSDEEVFTEEEGGTSPEQEPGQKTGFIPAFLLKILKYVAIGLAAIIFVVTIVIVTLRIMQGGQSAAQYPSVSESYRAKPPRYTYFEMKQIRTRTADEAPHTVMVTPKLGYTENDKIMLAELVARSDQIFDLIRTYFSSKTAMELMPQYEQEIKEDLKNRINQILSDGQIKDIVFMEFQVIEF